MFFFFPQNNCSLMSAQGVRVDRSRNQCEHGALSVGAGGRSLGSQTLHGRQAGVHSGFTEHSHFPEGKWFAEYRDGQIGVRTQGIGVEGPQMRGQPPPTPLVAPAPSAGDTSPPSKERPFLS